ncbi:hypothetical protein HP15_1977 [Marinobacter adhaerens HP15]|uniref:Uncharacterized protein n=1 Tax=Marinobacter adhaerens (strain DSM 23420 / HP15) TaxID=225937 RepID=E4PQM1_MARAH|nr:hypothetical protein HP15_1977 [Marinobacter adhaerens HP15]
MLLSENDWSRVYEIIPGIHHFKMHMFSDAGITATKGLSLADHGVPRYFVTN